MIRVVHPRSRLRMLTFYPCRIQGSKRHPIRDPGSATLIRSKSEDIYGLASGVQRSKKTVTTFSVADSVPESGALLAHRSGMERNPDPG
jgi:hypothetical protein